MPGYARLVPAGLLPEERGARTVRDWVVDIGVFGIAVGGGLLFFFGAYSARARPVSDALLVLDLVLGAVAILSLWGRRRWPVAVGIVTALASSVSGLSALASIVAMFTVAVHRRTAVAVAIGAINVVAGTLFDIVRPQETAWWVTGVVNVALTLAVIAWGLFVRARRELVATLRERAERAETEQRVLAEQARLAERTRIAREMHDVLAHRISLLALHAGGLQVTPDLAPERVRETAGLLRSTAQQALEELRGVIGVLRDEHSDVPSAPQPTLRDLPRLVAETRGAGARIELAMDVPDDVAVPDAIGRDAYRIVQEALTNVAKHATGTATQICVHGAPGRGLHVAVRNRLPIAAAPATLPGSGTGLLGLRERVSLAGGELTHGPDGHGAFVVDARLDWSA